MKMYFTIFSLTFKMNSLIKCEWETALEQVVLDFGQERHSKVYELDMQAEPAKSRILPFFHILQNMYLIWH